MYIPYECKKILTLTNKLVYLYEHYNNHPVTFIISRQSVLNSLDFKDIYTDKVGDKAPLEFIIYVRGKSSQV